MKADTSQPQMAQMGADLEPQKTVYVNPQTDKALKDILEKIGI